MDKTAEKEEVKHTVLLVEDEAAAALALGNALIQEGYNVLTAKDGEEGLALALGKHPDLILADLMLPKMSGMDMIKHIREDQVWGKGVEIIILTNVIDVKMLEQAMNQGSYFYIVKGNSSMANVIAKVNSRLKGHVLESQGGNVGV